MDIPAITGGSTAYAGFTGGTGSETSTQDILWWNMAPPPSLVVPFLRADARLQIGPNSFSAECEFLLGAPSNGINPATESVSISIGRQSLVIPPGSFQALPNGSFLFAGTVAGLNIRFAFVPISAGKYGFLINARGIILLGQPNPATVGMRIGDDGWKKPVSGTPMLPPA